ncbi:MAG: hypothetical protein K2N30_05290, partial [Clostridia bacterium]|nr:hypothetical protein [Clostridia bacterium]
MKKTLIILCLFLCAVCAVSGCAKEVNYADYISEKRYDIFVYEDDGITVKIYCSEKEQPYSADGIKGDTCPITEIFVTLPKNPQKVDVSAEGLGGEMHYRAVETCFYL